MTKINEKIRKQNKKSGLEKLNHALRKIKIIPKKLITHNSN